MAWLEIDLACDRCGVDMHPGDPLPGVGTLVQRRKLKCPRCKAPRVIVATVRNAQPTER